MPLPAQEPKSIEWGFVRERIAQADGVIVGTIQKLEEDWTYDDPCRFFQKVVNRCDGTVTYRLQVNDKWLWTFTKPYGNFGLFVGQRAVFVWTDIVVYRFADAACMQYGICGYDMLSTLTSDFDVLPVSDSAIVTSIWKQAHP